jgi:hypothetical protein
MTYLWSVQKAFTRRIVANADQQVTDCSLHHYYFRTSERATMDGALMVRYSSSYLRAGPVIIYKCKQGGSKRDILISCMHQMSMMMSDE